MRKIIITGMGATAAATLHNMKHLIPDDVEIITSEATGDDAGIYFIDEAIMIPGYGEAFLEPKYRYREPQREPREVKKKRKDFWNELPKPKRRRK